MQRRGVPPVWRKLPRREALPTLRAHEILRLSVDGAESDRNRIRVGPSVDALSPHGPERGPGRGLLAPENALTREIGGRVGGEHTADCGRGRCARSSDFYCLLPTRRVTERIRWAPVLHG